MSGVLKSPVIITFFDFTPSFNKKVFNFTRMSTFDLGGRYTTPRNIFKWAIIVLRQTFTTSWAPYISIQFRHCFIKRVMPPPLLSMCFLNIRYLVGAISSLLISSESQVSAIATTSRSYSSKICSYSTVLLKILRALMLILLNPLMTAAGNANIRDGQSLVTTLSDMVSHSFMKTQLTWVLDLPVNERFPRCPMCNRHSQ